MVRYSLPVVRFSMCSLSSDPQMRLHIRNITLVMCSLFGLSILRVFTVHNHPLNDSNLDTARVRRSLPADHSQIDRNRVDVQGFLPDLGSRIPRKWGTDVFISVKTTQKFHNTRLRDILDTWYTLAPDLIYFFTDTAETELSQELGDHIVQTDCSASHNRRSLSCKMGAEYDHFIKSNKRWFCHFDDDNYVNVPELMKALGRYDPRKDYYLGKPSTQGPIEIMDRMGSDKTARISFWFGTGGAGLCLSRSLAIKMQPFAADGKFVKLADDIRLPDDVTLGYIAEHILNKKLRVLPRFHSHLESMKSLNVVDLKHQISLSAGSYSGIPNVVPVREIFPTADDPNKFRSLHCFLFPGVSLCPRNRFDETISNRNSNSLSLNNQIER